ncbi:pseudouridine synthase [Spinellus fusiger]|nr:pseudouridine synthase [Spinellus fusiger]
MTEGHAVIEELSGNPPVAVGEKRKADAEEQRQEQNPKKDRRIKTSTERKEYFQKNKSWKAKDAAGDYVASTDPNEPKEVRHPKKKVALLIGYCGTGYQGMQLNKGIRTIEGEIHAAMVKAGAISKANAEDPSKINWMRTARTDKGVHSACNVISCKMAFPSDAVIDHINAALPDQIRVWGYIVTPRSFHAKSACDSRIYEYLLPTYAFEPPITYPWTSTPTADTDIKVTGLGDTARYVARSTPEELAAKDAYRVDPKTLGLFREALKMYIGTHNFHNYTLGRGPNDKSSQRYILNIEASDPLYIGTTEWVSVKLHGQSFMLHQIRKMISMALLVVRTGTPLSIIESSFHTDRINIPKAPAVGLLLERPVFDSFNKSLLSKQNANIRDPITFDNIKGVDSFKQAWIYKTIFESEAEERGFDTFLRSFDSHFGNDFKYLNSEGVIPEESIIITKYTQQKKKDDSEAEDEDEEE